MITELLPSTSNTTGAQLDVLLDHILELLLHLVRSIVGYAATQRFVSNSCLVRDTAAFCVNRRLVSHSLQQQRRFSGGSVQTPYPGGNQSTPAINVACHLLHGNLDDT